ncbi:MAG: cell wall anchor protein [Muribaculaceae bacterium]|nr:cell wall anchor protein [Muribaculaceae bacterium]
MKHIIKYSILLLALISFLPQNIVAKTTIQAKLDSVAILMGKQTVLRYQIVEDKGKEGMLLIENPKLIAPNVEIIGQPKSDTTDLDNNRIQIDRAYIIQSFDSGIWEIPAAKYIIGRDTVVSNKLNLKVVPVATDSLKTIHDYKTVEEAPFFIFDYIPDFIYNYWWVYFIVIILVVLGIIIYSRSKKGKPILKPKKKEIPPYEEAVGALKALKAAKMWQAGQEKEYYTRLTDILRQYIDRRFKINAIEMTSSQIIDTLKRNDETKAVNEQLKLILEIADYVKFANIRPLPDDNEAAFNRAVNFVEDTRPVIKVEAENEIANKEIKNKNKQKK